jgi:hypothetical protein
LRRFFHQIQPQLQLFSKFRSACSRLYFSDYVVQRYFQAGYSLLAQHNGADEVIRETDELLLQVEVFVLPVDELEAECGSFYDRVVAERLN